MEAVNVIRIFEQVFFHGVASENEFQLVKVAAPGNAVKEFRSGKLRFVECLFRITSSKVNVLIIVLREEFHRGGHQVHPKIFLTMIQIVKSVIVKGETAFMEK